MFLLLVDCALKATVLLALAWGAQRALGRASAAARHLMWALTLAGVLLLPALSVMLPGWRVLPGWYETAGVAVAPAPVPDSTVLMNNSPADIAPVAGGRDVAPPAAAAAAQPVPAWPEWRALMDGIYVLGVMITLVPVVYGYALLWRLRRRSVALMSEEWTGLLRELAARMGVARPVELLCGARQAMPVTWGILRPVILLPAAAGDWPEERRRCVLLHELAHIKRVDALGFLAARLVCAVYWFHPLAWLAAARLRAVSELACDDLVLSAGTKSSTYAAELVTIAQSAAGQLSSAAIAMARPNRPSQLHRRVTAILDRTRNRRRLTVTVVAGCLAGVAGLVLPLAMLRGQASIGAPSTTTAGAVSTTSGNGSVSTTMPGIPAPASAPAAGATLEGLPIVRIEIQGDAHTDSRTIMEKVQSKAGQRYSRQQVEMDTRLIASLDRFVSVMAQMVPVADAHGQLTGVVVRFEVKERTLVKSVQVLGSRKFTEEELRQGMVTRTGMAVDPFRIDMDRKMIMDMYRKKGDAQTTVEVNADAAQTGNVKFQITEGPPSVSRSATVPATTRAAAPRLQIRLVVKDGDATTPVDDLADPYNPGKTLRVARDVVVDESGLASVDAQVRGVASQYAIGMNFTDPAATKLGAVTAAHRGEQLAIVVDGKIIAAPTIQSTISKACQISFGTRTPKADVERIAGVLVGLAAHGPSASRPATAPATTQANAGAGRLPPATMFDGIPR